ncbi:hypothetical protein [Nocardia panacis]|nr:hypothetical protein [Nocardia panacis]
MLTVLRAVVREIAAKYRTRPPVRDSVVQVRRAHHLASAVRFGMTHPAAIRRLHAATQALARPCGLEQLLERALEGAIELTGADFGEVRLVDPETGILRMVAHHGAEQFAVEAGKTPEDETPFGSVGSTPLFAFHGELIGMITTRTRRTRHLSGRERRIMQLFGDAAGDAIARGLGPSDDADPIGRALMLALLAPSWTPGLSGVQFPPGTRVFREHEVGAKVTVSEFAGDIVNKLYSVGLTLHGARSLLREGPAGDRVDSAVADLDETIRQIYRDVFHVVADDLRD